MFTRTIVEYHECSRQPTTAVQTRRSRNLKPEYSVNKEYLSNELDQLARFDDGRDRRHSFLRRLHTPRKFNMYCYYFILIFNENAYRMTTYQMCNIR